MRTISVGDAELRTVQTVLEAAESNLPVKLNAKQRAALRTFLRRLSLADPMRPDGD